MQYFRTKAKGKKQLIKLSNTVAKTNDFNQKTKLKNQTQNSNNSIVIPKPYIKNTKVKVTL